MTTPEKHREYFKKFPRLRKKRKEISKMVSPESVLQKEREEKKRRANQVRNVRYCCHLGKVHYG